MKFIPILFSTPMVQAILDDRKTITRRIINPQPECYGKAARWRKHISMAPKNISDKQHLNVFLSDKCPYGMPVDVLWVRETTTILEPEHCMGGMESRFVYKTNMDKESEEIRQEYIKVGYPYQWKPSIFMKKEACRIFLEITDIRVERLHDITEADAKAEGVERNRDGSWHDYIFPERLFQDSAKASFQSLWYKINGEESWKENPWVWLVSFKKIERPAWFLS